MFWFWKYDFQNHHCKLSKRPRKKLWVNWLFFQNINAHYPQFHYIVEHTKAENYLIWHVVMLQDTSSCVEIYGMHCVWNFILLCLILFLLSLTPWYILYIHTYLYTCTTHLHKLRYTSEMIADLVPDHCNTSKCHDKASHNNFWFPSACKSYAYTIL